MNAETAPQPFPYQGSKRRIAPQILSRLPARMKRLVEPFAGSAAVSLAAAAHQRVQRLWINDANAPLISLWRAIAERPDVLADGYAALWQAQNGRARDFYDMVRDRFNERRDPADLLYLLARCVKAAVRYNAQGHFNNSPDNRRRGARPQAMRRRIRTSSELLRGRTRISSCDYVHVLAKCTRHDVIYLDPPYQGVGRGRDRRYFLGFDHDEFSRQLARLARRGMMFAVSYDGRSGQTTYGEPLPESLGLTRLEIDAGRSSQATLLGRRSQTVESLYLSPVLVEATNATPAANLRPAPG